ncbi:unnamed protein product [Boreogadus saida]
MGTQVAAAALRSSSIKTLLDGGIGDEESQELLFPTSFWVLLPRPPPAPVEGGWERPSHHALRSGGPLEERGSISMMAMTPSRLTSSPTPPAANTDKRLSKRTSANREKPHPTAVRASDPRFQDPTSQHLSPRVS